jgi:hypothetical protein
MTRKKKYLQLLQSLLSDDPVVRSNQVILDSSDFVTLSEELREWLARQSYHWVQLDTSAKILQAKSDCSLSQEAKDLFAKWAYQAEKQYLASIQRSSDKEAFEKHITKIKRQSIKDLRDLGISKQIAERIFHNHLLIEIAAELELDFSGLGEQEGHKQALTDSLKRDFYPYDGTNVPYIDIGWFSTGKIYGPPRLPLESVFRKTPFSLKRLLKKPEKAGFCPFRDRYSSAPIRLTAIKGLLQCFEGPECPFRSLVFGAFGSLVVAVMPSPPGP